MAELREIPLPEHLQNMPEFRIIDEIADQMVSDFEDEQEARHDDMLITTATELGIERREKILGILPDPEDSLESRRATVLFWWYNKMPYSRRVLERKVAALCGEGHYTFEYKANEQTLYVGIDPALGWEMVDIVYRLLDRLVMLNVVLHVQAAASIEEEAVLYVGVSERYYINDTVLRDDMSREETLAAPILLGIGRVTRVRHTFYA